MKVKDLIGMLEKFNPNYQVILQKDSEGNGYSPVAGAEDAHYVAEASYYGEVYSDEDDIPDNAKPCVVIWPVN